VSKDKTILADTADGDVPMMEKSNSSDEEIIYLKFSDSDDEIHEVANISHPKNRVERPSSEVPEQMGYFVFPEVFFYFIIRYSCFCAINVLLLNFIFVFV
jgi:hypothetical protein